MKKALCFVSVLLFLFAIVQVSTCNPAKPGSFAWVLRTVIWLRRQGVYDYGFNEGMRGPEDSEWVIACANRDDISFASNSIRIAHLEVLGGNLKDRKW